MKKIKEDYVYIFVATPLLQIINYKEEVENVYNSWIFNQST
jgi:hypothetical protein